MDRNNADVMKKMQFILNMRPVLNTEALFSDGSDYYRCPSNPKAGDKVRIRFRTKRNNVDMVYLVYDGKRQQMERVAKSNGFDYYETSIIMGEKIVRYHFEITYGWVTCYYNYQGVSMNPEERLEFEIYPDYDTPQWRRVLLCTRFLWIASAMGIRRMMWRIVNIFILAIWLPG